MSAVHALAIELADESARADIESIGLLVVIDGQAWYDLSQIWPNEERPIVERALRYMQLRGDELPYLEIHHPQYPYLRRFEMRR